MGMRIRVANPAGNITIFVMDKADRKDYAKISNLLLCMKEFQAEQVGFVEESEDGNVHMQMMGGEFCGNATRSFGYLMSMLSEEKPEEIAVSVSGSQTPLKVEVDLENGTSRTQMPLPQEIREVDLGEDGKYPLVVFDGICHMIVEGKPGDDAFVEKAIEKAKEICDCDAYGIMFLEGEKMTPVVYVQETNSLVWESSCGSGSMGAAVYMSGEKEDGTYVYELLQPGGIIEASVIKKNGRVAVCKMGGPVSISEEIFVESEELKG